MKRLAAEPDADPEALRARIERGIRKGQKVLMQVVFMSSRPSVTRAVASITSCVAARDVRVIQVALRSSLA